MATLALACALIAPSLAFADPEDLDPSFGTGGVVTTDFGGNDVGVDIAIDETGEIVVVGSAGLVGDYGAFGIARYHPDGSLDTSFSEDGKITTFEQGAANARAVAIDASGRIVAGGDVRVGSNSDLALARYNPDGSLDTSFGGNGIVTTNVAGANDSLGDLAIDQNGRIVVVGSSYSLSGFTAARYNPNGSLDTSFSDDGKTTTPFFSIYDGASAVAIDASNRVVAVGEVHYSGGAYLADSAIGVVRYNPDGTLDGKYLINCGNLHDYGYGVAIDVLGRIVSVGSGWSPHVMEIARMHEDGSLDSSWGDGGCITTSFGTDSVGGSDVVIDASGRILTTGTTNNGGNLDIAVARYTPNGSLDSSFSGDGRLTIDLGSGGDHGFALAIDASGRIVVAGTAGTDFAVVRLLGDPLCDHDGVLDAGEQCDLGTQNGAAGSCCTATCQLVAAATECRTASGACDVAEACDGTNAACPSDAKAASGTACGNATDDACTDADTCDGAGTCASNHATSGTACPTDSNVCTRDVCDGTGTCAHPAGNAATECRAASGVCDLAESCDGTSPTCPSNAAQTDGTSCDDGDACSSETVCAAGACGGGTTATCGPCERCTGAGGCAVAPRDDCKEVVDGCQARLKIFDNVADRRDKMDWEWSSGERTTLEDFDDPATAASGSDYALCLFDDPAGTPSVLLAAEVAAGEGWMRLGAGGLRGFRWQGRSGAGSAGLTKIDLRPGANGKAYVRVQGQGEALQTPALPLGGAVQMQLGAAGGACWQATFNDGLSTCRALRNDDGLFYGTGQ